MKRVKEQVAAREFFLWQRYFEIEMEKPNRQEWLMAVVAFQLYCISMAFSSEDIPKSKLLTMNDFLPGSLPLVDKDVKVIETEEEVKERQTKVSQQIMQRLIGMGGGQARRKGTPRVPKIQTKRNQRQMQPSKKGVK